ncbi:DUF4430 domain-containing protein [Clostridium rectalis]|uniref:DUF4430 domain-containing protein n=1 Tax=Clostridium rectalis TaxID=2040295 RepID=UPI000F6439C1|nr:DUF4430 domain-containing protein [Clostridium rectalis]
MKKIWKSFIAFILIIMSMTCTVFARIDLDISVNGNEVIIKGSSNHLQENVMIQTYNGDRKYYIDADKTNKNGDFTFKFKTLDNMDFKGNINVGGELKGFDFSTKNKVDIEKISLNKTKLQLEEGKSEKLIATVTPENASYKDLIWKSSDEKIATISENGEVKAVKEGQATISVSSIKDENILDSCLVTIVKGSGSGGSSGGGTVPKDKEVSVYMRVEGYGETIIPRTKVKVSLFDLNPYLGKPTGSSATPSKGWGVEKFKKPSNAHAIAKLLNDNHIDYDLQDYGWSLYMSMINGDREFDQGPMSGWMYSVNGSLPPVGCNGKPLKEGDEIVWFYGAYGFETLFTTFKANKTQVKPGEEILLELDGIKTVGAEGSGEVNDYGKIKEAINDATILVDDEEYKLNGQVLKTDESGKAKIKFDNDGTYKITAIRYKNSGNKKIDIVKPEPIVVKVGSGTSSGGGSSSTSKEEEEKALSELKNKLENNSVSEKELNITTENDKQVVTISESIITSKINSGIKILRKIEDKYKNVKIDEDLKVVPIKINVSKGKNTVFKLKSSIVNYMKDKNFGIRISFDDSEFRISGNSVKDINLEESIEIRKTPLANKGYEEKIKDSLNNKNIVAIPYKMELLKIKEDGKVENLNLLGCSVGIKVDENKMKHIRKKGLKINSYDSKNGTWKVLDSKYIKDRNVVVGKFN